MKHTPSHLMSRRLDRRQFLLASAIAASLATRPASRAIATQSHGHGGTPASVTDVDVTWHWTDDGAEVTPEITAGWNRVSIVNNRSAGAGQTHVLTLRLPDDITDEQMAGLMAEDAPFPDWARECYFPGIPDGVAPGASLDGYTWYAEGRYLWVDVFAGIGGEFTVGPADWNRLHPAPDISVDMVGMAFQGLDAPVAAGPLLWEAVNRDATWHEIVILKTPGSKTVDEIIDAMVNDGNWPMTGYGLRAGYGITSPGMSGMIALDLEPGDYAAACMAPDNFSGPPHALAGMIQPFSVE